MSPSKVHASALKPYPFSGLEGRNNTGLISGKMLQVGQRCGSEFSLPADF